jgi:hypothetical protein
VSRAKSSCEYDFQSKTSFVKNISSSDCDLVGKQITNYEIAKEIEYCNTNCSKVKERYLYWQQWEKSCSDITYADETCHQITDIALNNYHF